MPLCQLLVEIGIKYVNIWIALKVCIETLMTQKWIITVQAKIDFKYIPAKIIQNLSKNRISEYRDSRSFTLIKFDFIQVVLLAIISETACFIIIGLCRVPSVSKNEKFQFSFKS